MWLGAIMWWVDCAQALDGWFLQGAERGLFMRCGRSWALAEVRVPIGTREKCVESLKPVRISALGGRSPPRGVRGLYAWGMSRALHVDRSADPFSTHGPIRSAVEPCLVFSTREACETAP